MNTLNSTQRTWVVVIGILALAGIITVSIIRDRIVTQPYNQVSITGTGRVSYIPDTARITLGVHIEGETAQSALGELNAAMARVIPAIEALGISREKIGTQNLSIFPQYYYPESGPGIISNYTADQQLSIEINIASSSADMVGRVIQTANESGVNQVHSVTFETSNIDELRQAAVIEAIASARSRANAMADATGVELGDIISWWENPISVPGQPVPYYGGYGGEMVMDAGGMNIPSGSSEVIMEVNLTYDTK